MNTERLLSVMRAHGLVALVAASPENIEYSIDYEVLDGPWRREAFAAKSVIVPADSQAQPIVLTLGEVRTMIHAGVDRRARLHRYGMALPQSTANGDIESRIAAVGTIEAPSLAHAIVKALASAGVPNGRVAVDEMGYPELTRELRELESTYDFVPYGQDVFWLARMVKTPDEVELLRRVNAVNEAGIQAFLSVAGDRDSGQLDTLFRTVVGSLGASTLHFIFDETGRWSGGLYRHVGDNPHRFAGTQEPWRVQPRDGAVVVWDTTIVLDGYISDLGGVYCVRKEPNDDVRSGHKASMAVVQAGLDAARPGKTASQLAEVVADAIRKSGVPEYKGFFAGHGVGLGHHEGPLLRPPQATHSPFLPNPLDPELEEGMVLALEIAPRGCQNEVTAVVTRDGGRLLSNLHYMPIVGI